MWKPGTEAPLSGIQVPYHLLSHLRQMGTWGERLLNKGGAHTPLWYVWALLRDLLQAGAQGRGDTGGEKLQMQEQWCFESIGGWNVREIISETQTNCPVRGRNIEEEHKWSKVINFHTANQSVVWLASKTSSLVCLEFRWHILNIHCLPLCFLQLLTMTRWHKCHDSVSYCSFFSDTCFCQIFPALAADCKERVHEAGPLL